MLPCYLSTSPVHNKKLNYQDVSKADVRKKYSDQGVALDPREIQVRIRRMTHKYVEGQVRFSYDNQWLIRALRLRSWRTRRVNRMAGLSGSKTQE